MAQLATEFREKPRQNLENAHLDTTPLNSPHFVVGPMDHPAVGFPVMIALVPAGKEGAWLVTGKPGKVNRQLAATALAICALQRTYPFLIPTLNAVAEQLPFVVIGADGSWTDHRRLRYPTQILEAVSRLEREYLTNSSVLVDQMEGALQGLRPTTWKSVPPELGVRDSDNALSLLPTIAVERSDSALLQATFDTMGMLICNDYERNRYLRHLSLEELQTRAKEALLNTYELTAPGRWSINPFDIEQGRAFARFEEAALEADLRETGSWRELVNIAVTLGFKVGSTADWSGAFKYFDMAPTIAKPALARFGTQAHLERSRREGIFRLSAASSFADTYLGSARFDTEMVAIAEIDTRRARFSVADPDGENEQPLQPLRAIRRSRAETDALLLCFTRRVSPRLFQDFDVDACLLVHDHAELLARLSAATTSQLPGWKLWSGDMQYYDPFGRRAAYAVPLFCKTVAYAYQQEHRFLWIPPLNCESLDSQELSVGPIDDISELFLL